MSEIPLNGLLQETESNITARMLASRSIFGNLQKTMKYCATLRQERPIDIR